MDELFANPDSVEQAEWPGDLHFHVSTFLTSDFPPGLEFSSARALVINDARQVLVVRDPTSLHILPGGRVNKDESLDEAAQREVAEETGWSTRSLVPIGVLKYHQLRRPDDSRELPDFWQVIFAAEAVSYNAAARELNGYELAAEFTLPDAALLADLTQRERLLLEAAIAALAVATKRD